VRKIIGAHHLKILNIIEKPKLKQSSIEENQSSLQGAYLVEKKIQKNPDSQTSN
jgi:hypothetical protein